MCVCGGKKSNKYKLINFITKVNFRDFNSQPKNSNVIYSMSEINKLKNPQK